MAIGLTFDELYSAFGECTVERIKELQGSLHATADGENPTLDKLSKEIDNLNLPINSSHLAFASLITSIISDVIVRNNEALSKSLHLSE